jgi:hypothetical protein
MAAIIVAWFPETARRELEDINPEDRMAGAGTGYIHADDTADGAASEDESPAERFDATPSG